MPHPFFREDNHRQTAMSKYAAKEKKTMQILPVQHKITTLHTTTEIGRGARIFIEQILFLEKVSAFE